MTAASQYALKEVKLTVGSLDGKNKSKEQECDHLIKYQEEFRQEYIKVCAERDELHGRHSDVTLINDRMKDEMSRLSKETYDFKENLKVILLIQESPQSNQDIPQRAQMSMDLNNSLKEQVAHYSEKVHELTGELESQRTLFKTKMNENHNQLEES